MRIGLIFINYFKKYGYLSELQKADMEKGWPGILRMGKKIVRILKQGGVVSIKFT